MVLKYTDNLKKDSYYVEKNKKRIIVSLNIQTIKNSIPNYYSELNNI